MSLRQLGTAARVLLILTIVLGIAYPLAITGLSQAALGSQANGSLVRSNGEVVGSTLLGQSFTDEDGAALPEWFQSRPSAAGYDGGASVGSNYGPNNDDLVAEIEARQSAIEELDGGEDHPADAVTASGSGLDPHISPEYARLQIERVADARGLDADTVADLVESRIQGRDLGYLGEPTVNVLELNLALIELDD